MICIKCGTQLTDGSLFCNRCGKKQTVPSPYTRRRGNGQGTALKRGKTWTAVAILGWKWNEEHTKRLPVKKTKGGFKTKGEALSYIPFLKNEQPHDKITLADFYLVWSKNSLPKLSASKRQLIK